MKLGSYAENQWVESQDYGNELKSAVTGNVIATIDSSGLDFGSMVRFARNVGGPNLRKLSFHDRAGLLKALAKHLDSSKKEFYQLSTETGATKSDSWVDIDGGIGTMFVFAGKGTRELPNDRVLVDGVAEQISKTGSFTGQHVYLPLRGVAVHINAFNFPCWGMLEKLAPTILAGVPAIIKPASSTAYLTELMFRRMIDSGILPEGAVQLVCGSVGDLFTHLNCQDIVSFTGSKSTADYLRQHDTIISEGVRFSAETDSLNCAILGPDATPGTPEFDLYVDEIVKEMATKAGQKCTAIRRIIAPQNVSEDLIAVLSKRLAALRVGHPGSDAVDIGALASLDQRSEVISRIQDLQGDSELVSGSLDDFVVVDADKDKGAFFAPVLLHCKKPLASTTVHSVEAFGPVATVLPYADLDEAAALARLGEGSLVASIYTHDNDIARELVLETASYHGRMVLINRDCAKESTGHGSPLAHLVHGGPGRAGGSEELGGIRAVKHYMQRTALQGSPTQISAITNQWIRGAEVNELKDHPFTKSYHELQIGDTLFTGERLMSKADIEHFGEFTGDTFYAHMDAEVAARNPFFDGQVAHGYFIVAAAAGLFVEPEFGPVLANFGVDNLRFAKPVNAGDSIKLRLTCKQKTFRASAGYGEVRWDTEVTNQDGDIVATYDVLTMVATAETFAALPQD